jgi:hypothetical protein
VKGPCPNMGSTSKASSDGTPAAGGGAAASNGAPAPRAGAK